MMQSIFQGSRWTLQATTMSGKIVSLSVLVVLLFWPPPLHISPLAPFLPPFYDIFSSNIFLLFFREV